MFRSVSVFFLCLAAAAAQTGPTAPAPLPVEVPTFANPTCPIMGKKVSMPLFVDTELGRFHLCCKPCNKKVLADVKAAHKTAYPVVQDAKNSVCPVSGEPVGADAPVVTLQGWSFRICCAGCLDEARRDSQITLAKVTRPKVVEVGNETCPVNGGPVAANAFVQIGDALVRLSSPKAVEAVEKDPAGVLAKARELQKAQKPKPKHVHVTTPPAPPAEGPKKEDGK
jgi:hypothetical protein